MFIFVTFELHLWPSAFVKVTWSLIFRCTLCCWVFVPKIKFAGSVEFEIWIFVWNKNLNDVTMTSSPIWFIRQAKTNLQRAYQSGIPNFSLIKRTRAEIYSMEVNKELWRKNGYWATVTLTFDQRSPISIEFEPVC